jgi:hypothetical protein
MPDRLNRATEGIVTSTVLIHRKAPEVAIVTPAAAWQRSEYRRLHDHIHAMHADKVEAKIGGERNNAACNARATAINRPMNRGPDSRTRAHACKLGLEGVISKRIDRP